LLAIAALAAALFFAGVTEILQYDRQALGSWQLWRLFTGNLVHGDLRHLLLNEAGLALVVLVFGTRVRSSEWLVLILAAGVAVSAGLYLFQPRVGWYLGLSGALHGMLAGGAIIVFARARLLGGAILALLASKLLLEAIAGTLPWSQNFASGKVLTVAHLYGTCGGLIAGIFVLLWRSKVANRPDSYPYTS
jgi:rhomboid family GlyGly-CTERM serine protease